MRINSPANQKLGSAVSNGVYRLRKSQTCRTSVYETAKVAGEQSDDERKQGRARGNKAAAKGKQAARAVDEQGGDASSGQDDILSATQKSLGTDVDSGKGLRVALLGAGAQGMFMLFKPIQVTN